MASSSSLMGVSAVTSQTPALRVRMPCLSSESASVSSKISPTISSSTSSMVTSPTTPPYSLTTTAMWRFLVWNSCNIFLTVIPSGTYSGGASIIDVTLASSMMSGLSMKLTRSLGKAIPTILSTLLEYTGTRLYWYVFHRCHISRRLAFTSTAVTSTRGVITFSTSIFPSSRTFSTISASALVTSPVFSAPESTIRSSSSETKGIFASFIPISFSNRVAMIVQSFPSG
mmetsp:Transcript_25457/g.61328  ORF Transcript_25457/g.61328 Transcript_25457/m.61328 type:complete len:228 (+) Transcript_25457:599-1282(+)